MLQDPSQLSGSSDSAAAYRVPNAQSKCSVAFGAEDDVDVGAPLVDSLQRSSWRQLILVPTKGQTNYVSFLGAQRVAG